MWTLKANIRHPRLSANFLVTLHPLVH